jgi:hypothetical protein
MLLLQIALLLLPGIFALLTSPAALIRVVPLGNHYATELHFAGNLSLQSVVLDTGSTSLTVRLCSLIGEPAASAGCFENSAALVSALTPWNCSELSVDGDTLAFGPVQETVNGLRYVSFNAAVSLNGIGQLQRTCLLSLLSNC